MHILLFWYSKRFYSYKHTIFHSSKISCWWNIHMTVTAEARCRGRASSSSKSWSCESYIIVASVNIPSKSDDLYWHDTDPYNVDSVVSLSVRPPDALPLAFEGLYKDFFVILGHQRHCKRYMWICECSIQIQSQHLSISLSFHSVIQEFKIRLHKN